MLNTIPVLPTEKRDILSCAGYVLAEALHAEENIPPFDNSAMDGYAVRAADVQTLPKRHPLFSQLWKPSAAGYAPTKQVAAGQASRIMTGAMMPEGADAVVMQEVTQREGNTVKILRILTKLETSVSRVRASQRDSRSWGQGSPYVPRKFRCSPL